MYKKVKKIKTKTIKETEFSPGYDDEDTDYETFLSSRERLQTKIHEALCEDNT